YTALIDGFRKDFLEQLVELRKTARSEGERAETEKLSAALDDFWSAFNRLKEQKQSLDPDELPPDFTIAVNHLEAQTDVVLDAVEVSIRQQVANAAEVGAKAERLAWLAGLFSLLAGVTVAAIIVRKINEPLRQLTHGTRAIAKGQFWHRLPAQGKDEFAELARDFNVMTERLGELDQMKKDFVSHNAQ
ncbi:MAG: hypothetical protein DMF60_07835, partial [Acidobacteria bacterium]